jgi:hypothetical protein
MMTMSMMTTLTMMMDDDDDDDDDDELDDGVITHVLTVWRCAGGLLPGEAGVLAAGEGLQESHLPRWGLLPDRVQGGK